jgi:hypothetical protein
LGWRPCRDVREYRPGSCRAGLCDKSGRADASVASSDGARIGTLREADHLIPITVPSEVLAAAMPKIKQFERELPPGYRVICAGEYKEQTNGLLI